SCVFSPATVNVGSVQQTVTLTLATTTSTRLYPYGASFSVVAAGGSKRHSFGLSVPIVGQGDFSITAQATSAQPIAPSGIATYKVSVYSGSGFSSPVSLSASNVPANASVGFSSPTVYPGGFATMTVT